MRWAPLGGIILMLATTGCGVNSPSNNNKENFSGTVQPNGTGPLHAYTFSKRGELEVTVTSVTPTPPSGQLLLAVGIPTSGVCQPLVGYIRQVVVNNVMQFGLVNSGPACVTVYDSGAIRAATNYAGSISYP
jgi:hypothetical protein